MAVYVDGNCLMGPCRGRVDADMHSFQAWALDVLVTGMHCAWFHVFDFACGQLQWLGLRSCRFHVGAGAFGAWLCLWEITRVFGKNNLVP